MQRLTRLWGFVSAPPLSPPPSYFPPWNWEAKQRSSEQTRQGRSPENLCSGRNQEGSGVGALPGPASIPPIWSPEGRRRDILGSTTKWRKHFSQPYPSPTLNMPHLKMKKKKIVLCVQRKDSIFFHNKKVNRMFWKLQIYFSNSKYLY